MNKCSGPNFPKPYPKTDLQNRKPTETQGPCSDLYFLYQSPYRNHKRLVGSQTYGCPCSVYHSLLCVDADTSRHHRIKLQALQLLPRGKIADPAPSSASRTGHKLLNLWSRACKKPPSSSHLAASDSASGLPAEPARARFAWVVWAAEANQNNALGREANAAGSGRGDVYLKHNGGSGGSGEIN